MFVCLQVKSTPSTACTMFTVSIPGWGTWPNTLKSYELWKPSWALMSSYWTPVSSVNTQQSNLMEALERMDFHMWPGIRIWGRFKSWKAAQRFCFAFLWVLSDLNCFVGRYWGIAGGPVLSVWLALDDSLKENGALQVIPGTKATHLYFVKFVFCHSPGWTFTK